MLEIGSLFAGYGGLDLGISAVLDAETVWVCEYEAAPSKVLDARFGVPNIGDVTKVDWRTVPRVDILCGGYPCQPFSHAGKRKGTDDLRHLWPHFARAIGHLRPGLVVLENVRGHLSLGFDAVLGDLADLGYDARWGVVRAADAGAPHGRERLFVVATDTNNPRLEGHRQLHAASREGEVASQHRCAPFAWGQYAATIHRWERVLGRTAPPPTEPGSRGPHLSPRFVEWMMGLPAGWVTDVPGISRNDQLKMLGNGVVPQQAALALRTLLAATSREVCSA